jgi:hypothetical protein
MDTATRTKRFIAFVMGRELSQTKKPTMRPSAVTTGCISCAVLSGSLVNLTFFTPAICSALPIRRGSIPASLKEG